MSAHDLPTPALVIDLPAYGRNVSTMSEALPGPRLRPHVKAFKSTAMARDLADRGHRTFCAATSHEIEGMASAGLREDLLLANESVDRERLARLAALDARVTVAVDSEETIAAAAEAGIREVLIDVLVGFRCGCEPEEAGRLADLARSSGLEVRGTMGYEAHVVLNPDRSERERLLKEAMDRLERAHADVGGDVISGGGTGTYDLNRTCNEIQAGSFTLMDTEYAKLDIPFELALYVQATVISVAGGTAVCDAGLKSLGMDHGDPTIDDADVFYCSDEHVVFVPREGWSPQVGDTVRVWPAHVDPTVAKHERFHLVDGDEVVDTWEIDLRHW